MNLQSSIVGIARFHQPLIRIVRDFVLRIALVVGPGQHDFARLHEGAQVVDVTVSLILDDALAQPDDIRHAQIFVQQDFQLPLVHVRIAIRIREAFFGRDERAFAIHMNGAAFENQRRPVSIGAFDLGHLACHQVVLVPWKVQTAVQATPRIEDPIDGASLTALANHKGRSHVAHPRIVARHLDHSYGIREQRTRIDVLAGRNADRHRLARGDRGCHSSKCCLRRTRAEPPIVGPFRP